MIILEAMICITHFPRRHLLSGWSIGFQVSKSDTHAYYHLMSSAAIERARNEKNGVIVTAPRGDCAAQFLAQIHCSAANRLRKCVRDLTKDSIVGHILATAIPIAIGMLAQIAYQLISLYFVTRIGVAATAGVNAASSTMFIVDALTLVLVAGTVSPVAHAIGCRDRISANLAFNQSMMLAIVCSVMISVLFYVLIRPYLRLVAADSETVTAGVTFTLWALPGFAILLPMAVFSCALRAIGIVQPAVAAYMLTVIVNIALAPFLIAGWATRVPLGMRGAGLATSISVTIGIIFLSIYFHRLQSQMAVTLRLMRPQLAHWRRILSIGLPIGMEFGLMFLSTALVYYVIRNFDTSAQAGFGIGWRVFQALLLPGMVVAISAAPIVSQNFGAQKSDRVKETFRKTALVVTALMIATTAIVQGWTSELVSVFDPNDESTAVAAQFLQLVSWTAVMQGLVYTCSTVFQGLGNTMPSLVSAAVRFVLFAIPAVWLSTRSHFRIEQVWYLLIASTVLQAVVSWWLLHVEFRRQLVPIVQNAGDRGAAHT